jgi:hypothetical protein
MNLEDEGMRLHTQTGTARMRQAPNRLFAVFLLAGMLTCVDSQRSPGQERAGSEGQEGVRRQALMAIQDLLIDIKDFDDRGLSVRVHSFISPPASPIRTCSARSVLPSGRLRRSRVSINLERRVSRSCLSFAFPEGILLRADLVRARASYQWYHILRGPISSERFCF